MTIRKARYISDGVFGPDVDSPADPIVNDAWDAPTPAKMVKLARKALSVDLDAIDAYNILGIHAETQGERIALFREAVVIGERLFAPAFAEEDFAWWEYLGTRPWLRAQHNLGLALMSAGANEEAAGVFKRLLALNPNDNQGVRMLVLQLAAEAGDYGECKRLFTAYKGDNFLEFVATRLLVDIATKRKVDFESHFAAIRDNNPHLLPLLASAAKNNRWPRAPDIDMVAWGSKDAAAIYLTQFKAAWQRKPKLLAEFLEAYPAHMKKDAS